MKKASPFLTTALALLGFTVLVPHTVKADTVDFDIVAVESKKAQLLDRTAPVNMANDIYLVVDRSAYNNDEQKEKVLKLVDELVDSVPEGNRIALAYTNSHSSSIKLTQALTTDKELIKKQLVEDNKVVNAHSDTYPLYGEANNIFSYIDSLKDKNTSHFVYVSDGDAGKSKFILDRYQLGVLSTESLSDFFTRNNVLFEPIALTTSESPFVKQFQDHKVAVNVVDQFFKNQDSNESIIQSFKSDLQKRMIKIQPSSKTVVLKSAKLISPKKEEIVLTIENNMVNQEVELTEVGEYTLMYQISGDTEDTKLSVTQTISNPNYEILANKVGLQKTLDKVVNL